MCYPRSAARRRILTVKDIREGGFYVNETKGYVREAARITNDGIVRWRAYFFPSGESAWSAACSLGYFMRWAEREASAEEIGRMRRSEAEFAEIEAEADLTFRFLKALPDALLLEEVRRRGLV